jgi:hypothetical protein
MGIDATDKKGKIRFFAVSSGLNLLQKNALMMFPHPDGVARPPRFGPRWARHFFTNHAYKKTAPEYA